MNKKSTLLFSSILFGMLSLAACSGGSHQMAKKASTAPKPALASTAEGGNWLYVDHDLTGSRYSSLTQITPQNAGQLGKVCSYTFPEKAPSESMPIVSDGVVYVTTAHYTVALDGSTCKVKWLEQWKPRDAQPFLAQRGAAIADGKIVRGTPDGYLIALNASNGHLLWAHQIANSRQGYFISMPPLIHNGLIYVGPAGAEWASSGWVGAFRLSDGAPVWKFHIVPLNGQPGASTWGPNPAARTHAGGNIWTPLSFNVRKDVLYVSGGNPAPDFYSAGRPGANLYTESIIALNGKTGKLLWYRQFLPHETHDYDITHASPIFRTKIDGKVQTAIATSGKDGMLRVVSQSTHKILYSTPFTKRLNADTPLTTTRREVCPGTLGGEEWNGTAYDPQLNLLILPTVHWCAVEASGTKPPSPAVSKVHGRYFGGYHQFDPWSKARGHIAAFDASTGKLVWRFNTPEPQLTGVAVTAANVAFTGEMNGNFDALDAKTGKLLYHYDMKDSVQGGVATYAAHGKQYVAIVSGAGAFFSRLVPQLKGGNTTVTIFGLRKK